MSLLRALRYNSQTLCRHVISRSSSSLTDGEVRIKRVLKEKFPQASALKVVDISGGCGAMYEIHIESDEFKGKRTVQQHQLVNQIYVTHYMKGVVLTVIINAKPRVGGFLLMLDGKSFKEVARACVDVEIHMDMHGYFIPDSS